MKGGIIIEIKIIGANCSNGIKLKKELKRALEGSEIDFTLMELNDPKHKKVYNVQNIPALVINDDIVSEGKVLSEREITRIFGKYFLEC